MSDYLRFLLCLVIFSAIQVDAGFFGTKGKDDYDEDDYDLEDDHLSTPTPEHFAPEARSDVCVPLPLGGVAWIRSAMNADYGWGDATHRAVIALALNRWEGVPANHVRQMELQLDVEITKSLLRNLTQPVHPTDLALHIHALIATRRNPRSFYGRDLVALLLQVVDRDPYTAHPFLLLALCNCDAAERRHAHYASALLKAMLAKKATDLVALALQAYSCMKTLDFEVDETLIQEASDSLLTHQAGDGSFGNLYTTSLIVQALFSAGRSEWDSEDSLAFLKTQSTVNPNMVSTYLIELALHSNRFPFLKKLHPGLPSEPVSVKQDLGHYVQYSIKVGKSADVYFTITLKVPQNSTFFDVMKISEKHDSKFNFSYYLDKERHPSVYSISGVPNDAEGNLYWRLCLMSDVNHDRHDYRIRTVEESPALLIPEKGDHVIYWFRDSDCGDSS